MLLAERAWANKKAKPIRSNVSFLLDMASILAEKKFVDKLESCLKFMWKHFPDVKLKQVMQDEHIHSSITKNKALYPVLKYEKSHNILENFVRVTNHSLYSVTKVFVKVSYRKKGNLETVQESLIKPLITAGGIATWPNVFNDAGWLGGNIQSVQVNVSCDEQRYFNSNSS
ncbi:MAG: hypothetical protein U9O82_02970 [Thermodesulfobacteriota bacterium]|nr:hypothetical protein [Thermodesulfobacteriota bacterium]